MARHGNPLVNCVSYPEIHRLNLCDWFHVAWPYWRCRVQWQESAQRRWTRGAAVRREAKVQASASVPLHGGDAGPGSSTCEGGGAAEAVFLRLRVVVAHELHRSTTASRSASPQHGFPRQRPPRHPGLQTASRSRQEPSPTSLKPPATESPASPKNAPRCPQTPTSQRRSAQRSAHPCSSREASTTQPPGTSSPIRRP